MTTAAGPASTPSPSYSSEATKLASTFQCRLVRINEYWLRSDVARSIGSGDEGQRGHDDLVAGLDPYQQESQVQCGGAAREGRCVWHADPFCQLAFERIHVRTEWCDPVRIERIEEKVSLLRSRVGR